MSSYRLAVARLEEFPRSLQTGLHFMNALVWLHAGLEVVNKL
jgi:hypothetical protein